jgi:signal transduction histidine kinase/CheY-like chemotaxis protein
MKLIAALLTAPLLVVFVTWLSLSAITSGAAGFDRALDELDHIAWNEADLHRDVLSARAGLLRNYDPLVQEEDALDASVAALRASMAGDAVATAAIDRLAGSLAQQEEWVEQFKSTNALLQNSLAYFAVFSASLTTPGQDSPLPGTVSMLATAMLRLTLDTSPAAAAAVQMRLDQLAEFVPADVSGRVAPGPVAPGPVAPGPVAALLAHGRLLHNLLPTADGIVRSLSAVPSKRDLAAIRTIILARQDALRIAEFRSRIVLYLTSLCLMGLLCAAGWKLWLRSRAIRRRAAFEHVLADVSMRFVAARTEDLDATIDAALEQMARCVDAERAYFIAGDPPGQLRRWSMPGIEFPANWPARAVSLAGRGYPKFGEIVHVARVWRLPRGADRNALAHAGLQGWACVAGRGRDGETALLGFDAVTHPCRIMRVGELGLLRMALDVVANARDRRALEQERTRLETRLQQARRLETIGALASGIAHNFNNIIGAILGYTEMANERSTSSRTLEEIRRAGERARELVDQILTFAGRRNARPRPIDVHAVIAEATSLLRASLPATVELAVAEAPTAMVVAGVHAQLLQVVLNLCNNAAQAMGHAGRVELQITAEEVEAPRSLSHGSLLAGRFVRIAVGDTGRGIDDAALAHLFEPFFTTRATGNGLGLATTREIVRDHGGVIHVESTPYEGSRFDIWLPCIDAAIPNAGTSSAAFPSGHGETVLVLEPDSDRLLRDEELLAALGYEPVGFTRAADARAAYLAAPERFDAAVVACCSWSREAVLELTTALRSTSRNMPILLATSSNDAFGAMTLARAGISEVVSWPIKAAEIAVALQDRLRAAGQRQAYCLGDD